MDDPLDLVLLDRIHDRRRLANAPEGQAHLAGDTRDRGRVGTLSISTRSVSPASTMWRAR